MKIYSEIPSGREGRCDSLALGFFDGVHIGHRRVIESAVDCGGVSGVLTFNEHPLASITHRAPPLLISRRDKISMIERLGADVLYMIDFDTVRNITAENFILLLKERLGLTSVSCGCNFHLGSDVADAAALSRICAPRGIEVKISDMAAVDSILVSSTRIRQAVQAGDMPLAERMLGYPYGFTAEVIHGDRRGRRLGFPTINQRLPQGTVWPRHGVYISLVQAEERLLPGVTNIGLRPTYAAGEIIAETHILDFDGDLYGKSVEVRLYGFLRDEHKFAGEAELVAAVQDNIRRAREWFASADAPRLY